MKKTLSVNGYRSIDLFVFTILIILFEFVATWGTTLTSTPMYCISLFLPVVLLVMMRWSLWSIIVIIAGAITYCYSNDGTRDNYIIYIIGDLFILLNLLWFLKGKKNIREKTYMTVLYVLSGYFLIEIGRALVSVFLGNNFFKILISFLGTDSLSTLVALIIILVCRKQNGLFEDQIDYLKRVNKEEVKSKENKSF